MPYSLEELEHELTLPTPEDVVREIKLKRCRATCAQYGIEYNEAGLSAQGRIIFALIIAAKCTNRPNEAKRLQDEWKEYLSKEDNG